MDNFNAFNRPNSYPAYTLAELKAMVAAGNTRDILIAEIAYREANAL